ncbi:MAG: LysR family transcriptional regulator [Candidatus Binatus sp.]|uniref:LysR family transcriptional regulator n=1 Tax=Candidatus Binatus sp. TaxID=2811406 RepID=UPI003C75AAFC
MDQRARLKATDLNLLPISREFLRTRSVTRAAQALRMSQPAVSEALGRIRTRFEDDILVRVGRGMVPTRFALSLAPQVDTAIGGLEALLKPHKLDLEKIEREFIVATADTIILAIGSQLVSRLRAHAPRMSVQFIDLQHVETQALRSGDLDFIMLPRGILNDDGLSSFTLYSEEFVCIARGDHPEIKGRLTRKQIQNLTTVAYRADQQSDLLGSMPGKEPFDQVRVPQFTLLPFLVQRSDAVALIQRHVAERFRRILNLQIIELPVRFPRVEVRAYWGPIHDHDQAHTWLRAQMQEIVSSSIHLGG